MTNEERKQLAKKRFENHVATEVLKTDKVLIIDWREKSGSNNYFIRYILDSEMGELHVSGDLGYSVASWGNEVTFENMSRYVSDVGYYLGKLKATSDKFTYRPEDIAEDLEKLKEEFKEDIDEEDEEAFEEFNEDFEEIQRFFDDMNVTEHMSYPSDIIDIFQKYSCCWWESGFSDIGERIDQRVYLWSVGLRMAYDSLYKK